MTTADIIQRLFLSLTKERIQKAKGLAIRSKVEWETVLAAMTEDQRKAVEDVSH